MRKSEREIREFSHIETIIRESIICKLGMSDGHQPYVVPLSFGYSNSTVYFHSASEGKIVSILRKNPLVCVEFDTCLQMAKGDIAYEWGFRYECVVGFGRAEFIELAQEKQMVFDLLMKQYSDSTFTCPENAVSRLAVFKVKLTEVSAKAA